MEQIQTILEMSLGGNTLAEWAIAIGVFLVIFVALQLARVLLVKRLHALAKKSAFKFDDVLSGFFNSLKTPVFILVALFVAIRGVEIPESLQLILEVAWVVVIVAQVVRLLEEITVMLLERQFHSKHSNAPLPAVFRIAIRILLWSVGLLLILSNIGVDITSLVAGLGIGGLAVSLALQNILTDMFSSFSIAVDRPFEVGDFIIVGDHKGTVKHIGLKTTRITALEGEEVVISNTELTTARVQNYKKMQKRRIEFTFGCSYDAKPSQMKQIAKDVAALIDAHELAEIDRVNFKEFGNSELVFEAVYYLLTNAYNKYMETQEDINVQIMEYFEQNGLEMAFPTQTLYIKKED